MTNPKKIYCYLCGTYCGEIRQATLRKDLLYICGNCHTKQDNDKKLYDMPDFFKDLFNGKG